MYLVSFFWTIIFVHSVSKLCMNRRNVFILCTTNMSNFARRINFYAACITGSFDTCTFHVSAFGYLNRQQRSLFLRYLLLCMKFLSVFRSTWSGHGRLSEWWCKCHLLLSRNICAVSTPVVPLEIWSFGYHFVSLVNLWQFYYILSITITKSFSWGNRQYLVVGILRSSAVSLSLTNVWFGKEFIL